MKRLLAGLTVVIPALFSCGAMPVQAYGEVPWVEYSPQLETEYIIPFLYYDGMFHTVTYGRMSSVLRDREFQFFLWVDQREEIINCVAGYTRHYHKWSTGVNLYAMPVNVGPLWFSGLWENQTGISLLASYHRTNESRFTFRLQWESFFPLFVALSFPEEPESGSIFGWEAKFIRDDFSFAAQSGTREYISLGGAFPFLNTDYQYLKVEGDKRSYYPFNNRVSVVGSLRGGKIWGRYPSHRGFMIGGIQQANMSGLGNLINQGALWALADSVLRGYPLYRFNGDGFLLGNLELRMLLSPSSYYDIRYFAALGSIFLDMGQIWKNNTPLSPEPPAAWGMGLKFFLGGLLIGVDYAAPLNTKEHPHWHISLGEVF